MSGKKTERTFKKTYGETAYESYCEETGGKSLVTGAELPYWHDLPKKIQDAWEAAAAAVSERRFEEITGGL